MLHITNGDSAAAVIRACGVPGEVLPWRDVLHEGPVPDGLALEPLSGRRAAYLAAQGLGDEAAIAGDFRARDAALRASGEQDEVVLWFEHDLYDQLQLIQLLDWFAGHPVRRLTLINPPEYLGSAAPARLADLFASRSPVTPEQIALGRIAWAAFREPTPERLAALLERDTSALPFLGAAIGRLLEQLPGADDGLSRSERQVLAALREGERTAGALFRMHNALEDPVWLGDSTFAGYLAGLAAGPHPLIHLDSAPAGAWHQARASLTPDGRAVLVGEVDAVALRGVDRWLGGMHLSGHGPLWRWDLVARRLAWR